jgi:putative transposase
MQKFGISERLACRVLGQHRSTQRKVPRGRPDEEALTADIIALASEYGRYGYRRITALLRDAGWVVNFPDFPSELQISLRSSPYSCYPSESWAA